MHEKYIVHILQIGYTVHKRTYMYMYKEERERERVKRFELTRGSFLYIL